jgi:hypothetical protein
MKKMVGYCGYNCHLCAARSDDPKIRQKLVDGWRKYFGLTMYTAENVKCDGCLSDGKVADKQCKARPCAKKKGITSCAYCDQFPCKKLKPLINRIFFISEEDYNLCMRQFNSTANLTKILVKIGKPPFWVKKRVKSKKKKIKKQ